MQSPGCTCPRLSDMHTFEQRGLRFSGDLIWAFAHRHVAHFIVNVLQTGAQLLAVMKGPEWSEDTMVFLVLSLSHFLSRIKI